MRAKERVARLRTGSHILLGIGVIAAILIAAIVPYMPGVTGPFLFDTLLHLPGLARFTEYPIWERMFLIASFGDMSSPWLSRPLSFLTFILDDPYWPVASPRDFKFTNILLHALNAILLFWLLLRLSSIYLQRQVDGGSAPSAIIVAGMAALLWAAHPLQVSTVLYVVQRMTELGALFTLAALLTFLVGRQHSLERPAVGYLIMTAGLVLFGGLGFLSKQTAVLLLLYVPIIEFFLLRPSGVAAPKHYRLWLGFVIFLPIALVVGYLIFLDKTLQFSYAYREFSPLDRMLTEARILIDYLNSILLPRMHGTGLYHDDFPISVGLLKPPSTLFAIIVIAVLIAAALYLRRRQPILAFGIAWFFAGHLLESTVLPLELYIEHRNYLPMLGPLYALIFYAFTSENKTKALTRAAAIVFIGLSITLTALNSRAWGHPRVLAETWLQENPTSLRAIKLSAKLAENNGDYQLALDMVERGTETNLRELPLLLTRLRLLCHSAGGVEAAEIEETLSRIPNARLRVDLPNAADALVGRVLYRGCHGLTEESVRDLLDALLAHPQLQKPRYGRKVATIGYNLAFLLAKLHIQHRDLNGAMFAMDRAFAFMPYANARIMQANLLFSAGLYDDAWDFLQKAKALVEPDASRVTFFLDKLLPNEDERNIERLEMLIENQRKSKG